MEWPNKWSLGTREAYVAKMISNTNRSYPLLWLFELLWVLHITRSLPPRSPSHPSPCPPPLPPTTFIFMFTLIITPTPSCIHINQINIWGPKLVLGTGQIDKVAMRGKKCENPKSNIVHKWSFCKQDNQKLYKRPNEMLFLLFAPQKQNLSSFVISTVSFVPLRSRLASLDSLFFRKGGDHPWYQT